MELQQNNTYTTINPAAIKTIMYRPKHVTTEIVYNSEKSINFLGFNFVISDGGWYKSPFNCKHSYLGKNITCLDRYNEYSYEYNETTHTYTIYKNAQVIIIFRDTINKPVVFYYKDNSEAEKIYKQYSNSFFSK